MKSQVFLPLAMAGIALAACARPAEKTLDPFALETAVAQTLAPVSSGQMGAQPTPEPIESADAAGDPTVAPATIESTEPTGVPGAPTPASLKIAYLNGGDVWFWQEGGNAQPLTSRGQIEEVALSSDGQWVVYMWQDPAQAISELWAVSTASGGERRLLSQPELDTLYPLEDALHIAPFQFEFLPGSDTLLLNTYRIFEGPGLLKNDDLWSIEVGEGRRTMLLEPGLGGDFVVAPSGELLALVKPTSIGFARPDGSGLDPDRLTFPSVITYSEYAYYPIPVWSAASDGVGVLIPPEDPLADDTARVWWVPVDSDPARPVLDLSDFNYFLNLGSVPKISPDLSMLAYFLGANGSSAELRIAALDGSSDIVYDSGSLSWQGWNPNAQEFVYSSAPKNLILARVSGSSNSLGLGDFFEWVDERSYLYLDETTTTHRFIYGNLAGATTFVDEIAGTGFDYDFAR